MDQKKLVLTLIAILGIGILGFSQVSGVPYPTSPQTFNDVWSSQFDADNYPSQSNDAFAGNLTELVIFSVAQTKAWQGYFGNITGVITLDDANNNTFYNWSSTEPQGEIYASTNESITWPDIECYDFYNTSTGYRNVAALEAEFNIQTDDVDGVNETFTATDHPVLDVGYVTLSGCPTTYIFQDDERQTENFPNMMLYDPAGSVVFSSYIENDISGNTTDVNGYDGTPTDFQMLVLEDGHGNDTAVTTYYFWVELE